MSREVESEKVAENSFMDIEGCTVLYSQVSSRMTEPFDMSLTGEDAKVVEATVNQGIDSHLEACFVPERGDSFEWVDRRTAGGVVHTAALDCVVSAESMPVLLRRLFNGGEEAARDLADAILSSIRRG